jgi:tyrosyl-DNA phosphodiesterase 2
MSSLHNNIPLPSGITDCEPSFQAWHSFNKTSKQWEALPFDDNQQDEHVQQDTQPDSRPYRLVTWNVEFNTPFPAIRLSAILSRIFSLSPAPDIIFLQELEEEAFRRLLDETEIRDNWLLSDASGSIPSHLPFITVTLLSKRRSHNICPGPVWRLSYPSYFKRDALCCDISVPSASAAPPSRVRLVNVHLDSLDFKPSCCPKQLEIVASYLRSADAGLAAGDFNPVLPEDEELVEKNDLVDAWEVLRPGEPGFTWGHKSKQRYPPKRMDKIAMLNLDAKEIDVLDPGYVSYEAAEKGHVVMLFSRRSKDALPCSDHSGLVCSFTLSASAAEE